MKSVIRTRSLLLDVLIFLSTPDETSSSGGDETGFLTVRSEAVHGRGVTNVLMVTTTMGMLDWVHGNTSNDGPVLALCLSLVSLVSGLEHGLVGTLTTSTDSNHSTASAGHGSSGSGGEHNTGLLSILTVALDDGGASGSASDLSSVSDLGLQVADDSSLGHGADGEDISNSELGLASSVDVLTGVHALNSDEVFGSALVSVGVTELDAGERCTTAGVVNDLLDNTLDVATRYTTFPYPSLSE